MISSDPAGEGAIIADGCFRAEEGWRFRRGSKLLASMDWLGRDQKVEFESLRELLTLLDKGGVSVLAIDTGIPARHRRADHELLEQTVVGNPDHFQPIGNVALRRKHREPSQLRIYRVR